MSQILNQTASVFNFDTYLYYFRYPPSDACERLKDGLTALNYLEVSDREEITDVEEVHKKRIIEYKDLLFTF